MEETAGVEPAVVVFDSRLSSSVMCVVITAVNQPFPGHLCSDATLKDLKL